MKDRIKRIRKYYALSQEEFAERLGIARSTIANYETAKNVPIDAVIALICREFDVSEEWLRTGEGEMFRPNPADELEQWLTETHTDPRIAAVIRRFATWPKNYQKFILDEVEKYVEELNREDAEQAAIDAEVDEYRRELELEKRAAGKSSESESQHVG